MLSPVFGMLLGSSVINANFLYYDLLKYIMYAVFAMFLAEVGPTNFEIGTIAKWLFILWVYYYTRSIIFPVSASANLNVTPINWIYPLFLCLVMLNSLFIPKKLIILLIKFIKITIATAFVFSVIQATINASFGVSEYYFSHMKIYTDQYTRNPSIFSFLTLNDIGFSFLPLFSLLIGWLILEKKSLFEILLWSIMAGVTAFFSNSRYIVFGFLIMLLQLGIITLKDKKIFKGLRKISVLPIVAIFVLIILIYAGYDIANYFADRLFSEGSDQARIFSYFMFLKYFPDNPFFGTGVRASAALWSDLGGSDSFMQIHIGYLSHLYEYGIIGSIFWFGLIYQVLKKFVATLNSSSFSGSLFAFLVFVWANLSLVEYSFYYYGILIAFLFDKYYSQERVNILE